MIVIKGNRGTNVTGNLIEVDTPQGESIEIVDNEGQHVGGDLVKVTVNDSNSLGAFSQEALKHIHELNQEQREIFKSIIDALLISTGTNKEVQKTALQNLFDFSKQVGGSVFASLIAKFLSGGFV